jgi:agmatine/peptidylarginine deiminase
MLTWPHPDTDWGPILDQVEAVYVEIARAVLQRQQLLILCRDQGHLAQIRERLVGAGMDGAAPVFRWLAYDDTWARDHGPLTVVDGDGVAQLRDFCFNGWGGKYPASRDDGICAELLAQGTFGGTSCLRSELVLEGGGLESDGQGTLLATRSSLLVDSRNPGISQPEVEGQLSRLLGIERFHWLDHGQLSGDDTDGHIDTLARFVDPSTILHVSAAPDDPDAPEIGAMIDELRGLRQADGAPYRLVALPPAPMIEDDKGRRLAASYANFLIINGALLMPVYGDPADRAAVACVQGCFPQRELVPIDCRPLIQQNGSLHCVTMQFPRSVTFHEGQR